MYTKKLIIIVLYLLLTALFTTSVASEELLKVGITPHLQKFDFTYNNKSYSIVRNQDQNAKIKDDFARTSRACPPFCIQPIVIAPGVETLGEVEMIRYIDKMVKGEDSILIIDSRTPKWIEKGTIPGATNLPWTQLNMKKGAKIKDIMKIITTQFNARVSEGMDEIEIDEAIADSKLDSIFDYTHAKTLVLFCNGMWCGQSPNSIQNLLKFGYPVNKLKWYRGGMQDWEILGLSTVTP